MSRWLMIGLLPDGGLGQLLSQDVREGLENPLTLRAGKGCPELGEGDAVR